MGLGDSTYGQTGQFGIVQRAGLTVVPYGFVNITKILRVGFADTSSTLSAFCALTNAGLVFCWG